MKLLSARAADVDDIRALYDARGFTNPKEGLRLVADAYPAREIPPQVRFMIEEMFPPEPA